jgi:SAM-dependent methyltransferase
MDTQNINTKEYWDHRFSNSDVNLWTKKSGEQQTKIFAHYIAKRLTMPRDFSGTILDLGCALGDAIPIYKKYDPKAKFTGADFSITAIEQCKEKFGDMAAFLNCDVDGAPSADVIIDSNIFGHLTNDKECALKNAMPRSQNVAIYCFCKWVHKRNFFYGLIYYLLITGNTVRRKISRHET